MERRLENLRIWAWRYRGGPRSVSEYLHMMATPESWGALIGVLDELKPGCLGPERGLGLMFWQPMRRTLG